MNDVDVPVAADSPDAADATGQGDQPVADGLESEAPFAERQRCPLSVNDDSFADLRGRRLRSVRRGEDRDVVMLAEALNQSAGAALDTGVAGLREPRGDQQDIQPAFGSRDWGQVWHSGYQRIQVS